MKDPTSEATRLLKAWSLGDEAAFQALMPLVERELREIAARHLNGERLDHTLQPTALVNELYMRLADRQQVSWQNRAHFLGTSAEIMRRILVDHARGHKAAKRGGGQKPVSLEHTWDEAEEMQVDLVALNDALIDLEKLAPRQARVVVLRFFAGLTFDEVAEVLDISPRSAKRDWSAARLWLFEQLSA